MIVLSAWLSFPRRSSPRKKMPSAGPDIFSGGSHAGSTDRAGGKVAGRTMVLHVKRVYEDVAGTDGKRILVDRLWPRGLTKAKAKVDIWLKAVAPSPDLRRWFGHDPAKWSEFRRRYRLELENNPAAVAELRNEIGRSAATLLYGARDEAHNQAIVLKEFLDEN